MANLTEARVAFSNSTSSINAKAVLVRRARKARVCDACQGVIAAGAECWKVNTCVTRHVCCHCPGATITVLASSGDRPLTDAQEKVLIALADAADRNPTRYHPDGWQAVDYVLPRRQSDALIRLEELGLIETHAVLDLETVKAKAARTWPATRGTGARVTGAGRSLLLSMGD